MRFSSPLITACLHPLNPHRILAIGSGDDPFVLDIDPRLPEPDNVHKQTLQINNTMTDSDKKEMMASNIKFDPKGEHIYVSSTKGVMLVYDMDLQSRGVGKLTGGASITSFYFSANGRYVCFFHTIGTWS